MLQLANVFGELYEVGDRIVSGGCKQGADRFAEIIAAQLGLTERNGMLIIHRPADVPAGSSRYAYTKANYARNALIAADSDVLIAVAADDRKGGTENTVKTFKKRGLKPIILDTDAVT